MYLYQGAVNEFVRDAQLNRLADKIADGDVKPRVRIKRGSGYGYADEES